MKARQAESSITTLAAIVPPLTEECAAFQPLDYEALDRLAGAFEYPTVGSAKTVEAAASSLMPASLRLGEALDALSRYLKDAPIGEAEERYTSLFDLSPVCTLHLGYHLFGDAYQRGALLAGLAAELRIAGLTPGRDLPDFLPTVLRLLGRVNDPEKERILTDTLILPALLRMNRALESSTSLWAGVLRALPDVVAPYGSGTPEPDESFCRPTDPEEVNLDA